MVEYLTAQQTFELTKASGAKGGEKVNHCGGGIVYHRHDEKGLNWEPGGVRVRGPQVRSESGVFPIVRDLVGGVLPAVPEAVAVAVHLQDVDVVGETVQQRTGQAF